MKTYGNVAWNAGYWCVEAAPHVALKLRRVFPRIRSNQHGVLTLKSTPEVGRDLAWFLERYPMVFHDDCEKRLQELAEAHHEQEQLVDLFQAGKREAPQFPLALPPREYQRVAAQLVLTTRGLLVADDVGLGKTCTSICVLTDLGTLPALIVTLTHLPRQWEAEIHKFAPHLRTHVVTKTQPYDLTRQVRMKGGGFARALPDVIIMNYHKLASWSETLAGLVKCVVYDEVQELRHGENTKKGTAAFHISAHADYRVGLSATPIYNYGGEFYNVLEAVQPGALGTYEEFQNEWCTDTYGDKPRIRDAKVFGAYLRDSGLMIRRTREEVGRELPAVTRVVHRVDTDTDKLNDLTSAAHELAARILSEGGTKRGEKFQAAQELSWMVRHATGVAKAPYVAEFVRMIVESGEKVVLFGWHRDVYEVWKERLKEFNPVLYTGSETTAQKEAAKKAFIDGDSRVFIMSLRSGAGLDGLQHHACTAVFGELDWAPGVHEQCEGRVARDGQLKPVMTYFLLSDEGSDPIVEQVLGLKSEQLKGVRDPKANIVEKLEAEGTHVKRLAEAYLKKAQAPTGAKVFSMRERQLLGMRPKT